MPKVDEFVANAIICLLYMMGLSSAILVFGGLLRLWQWWVRR